jgi:hypothetical protein
MTHDAEDERFAAIRRVIGSEKDDALARFDAERFSARVLRRGAAAGPVPRLRLAPTLRWGIAGAAAILVAAVALVLWPERNARAIPRERMFADALARCSFYRDAPLDGAAASARVRGPLDRKADLAWSLEAMLYRAQRVRRPGAAGEEDVRGAIVAALAGSRPGSSAALREPVTSNALARRIAALAAGGALERIISEVR